jgi:hypothetical protein
MKKTTLGRIAAMCLLTALRAVAQDPLSLMHGDESNSASGLHSGNQIKASFYNDGLVGKRYVAVTDIGGEWPINSGHVYINQQVMFVGAEVKNEEGSTIHIVSEGNGCTAGNSNNADSGDSGPNGEWYSMTPLPGFHNPQPPAEKSDKPRIAMSHWDWSWPASWPDKTEDAGDPGWPGSWNGYFGKGVLNADQESMYYMDDYNNREFSYYPDSMDVNRRGLGLRALVRGFQWSNVLVEDILFLLYDVKNIGTRDLTKMNFGIMSGPIMGNTATGGGSEGSDDGGAYDLSMEIGYHLDQDNIGYGGWNVGFLGQAFFESPGNPYDGIDNDGDGMNGPGPVISQSLFDPRPVRAGDDVIVTDYRTFVRSVVSMPAAGLDIPFQGRIIHIDPGQDLFETPNNLFDDNLNGIIDENNGSTFGEGDAAVVRFLYEGLKYVNYFTGEGRANPLIDERRDDGIDNDGDWDVLTDDVGMDGAARSGDAGENDGVPTSGRGTLLPGEPHIDVTDIHESDMIGLTAFNIYTPWTLYPLSDDEKLWTAIAPGYLNATGQIGDTDILVGSGYFPLKAGQTERFSIGVVFSSSLEDLFRNKQYAQKTYDENYNFSKAPYVPTVTAVAGDGRVTLYWDDVAESSDDPITGMDFEGYRIYRSTDPGFNDMTSITDGFGSASYRKPVVQFDLDNGISGFSGVPVRGVHFWLGDDTGLLHVWTDESVVNGQKYYYAVTSYDRGSDSLGIAPTECSKYISISPDGTVDKGKNVAIVRAEAPSAGYRASGADAVRLLPGGAATGTVGLQVIDPLLVKGGHVYHVTFEEELKVVKSFVDTLYTKRLTLTDVTAGSVVFGPEDWTGLDMTLPVTDGFELTLHNEAGLAFDSASSGWSRPGLFGFTVTPYAYREEREKPLARDFDVVIGGSAGFDTSETFFRRGRDQAGKPVNFTVLDAETRQRIPFGFYEADGADGVFSGYTLKRSSDEITVLSRDTDGVWLGSWIVKLATGADDSLRSNPTEGDTLRVRLAKPFLAHDVFEFTMQNESIDEAAAKDAMDRIRVVPNPYIVANSFEPQNPYANGRGPREIHFTHLPAVCTIKIFNLRGQLVRSLDHNTASLADGTEIWDMQTKDNLDVAYGVYVFHVDAGDAGQKIGKFAIVK